jgi:hypothetical protein
MNNLKISKDIKNIIIKYTLPPINKTIRNELNKVFTYYIGRIRICLDNNYILNEYILNEYIKNFNNTKYKLITTSSNSYWTLRLKTDL